MKPFARGAQKRLAFSKEVPGLKSQDGFYENELYAAHLEIARLRWQVEELLPAALIGAGYIAGSDQDFPDDELRSAKALHGERLLFRLLSGEFGEVKS
jgi:hypothetical protein